MIKCLKLHEDAVLPTKAHPTDTGYDLVAVSRIFTENYIEYDTGIAIELPRHYYGRLVPRSSISNYDLIMCNSIAIIDPDYRGSLKFRFKFVPNCFQFYYELKENFGNDHIFRFSDTTGMMKRNFRIYDTGDKIGQLEISKDESFSDVRWVNELSETKRGAKGFGSSGK